MMLHEWMNEVYVKQMNKSEITQLNKWGYTIE